MRRRNWWKTACAVCALCATTAIALPAQTFTTRFRFDKTDGANPYARLVQGTDGNLYGTTGFGGANGDGTVFKVTPNGVLTTLYSFCSQSGCADGENPYAGLVQVADGSFYGTAGYGGAGGTVFKMNPNGAFTTLYSFCAQPGCVDGRFPLGGLIQAVDGNFYGTTYYGGANGLGTIFTITPGGKLTSLHSFDGSDGAYPTYTALVEGTDGNLYGTTEYGGTGVGCPYGCGTTFKITPSGALTTLHNFCSQTDCGDGAAPVAPLVHASDGDFYGTTAIYGGANSGGTVFKITPGGTLTTLYSFCSQSGCADGDYPLAGLLQATNGNLYGTTASGGAHGWGTAFEITPNGELTTLYSFCSKAGCADGAYPFAALMQDTNGNFYGTASVGGVPCLPSGCGTMFSLSVGLGPSVETRPTSGAVGKPVKILGTNLTGTSSVTFNSTAATFTVESSSLIRTNVPAGATSGTVQVVTPGGTLSSNVPFRVVQ